MCYAEFMLYKKKASIMLDLEISKVCVFMYLCMVLGLQPRKSYMLWKCSITEMYPPLQNPALPWSLFFFLLSWLVWLLQVIYKIIHFFIKTFNTVSTLKLKMEMCGQE